MGPHGNGTTFCTFNNLKVFERSTHWRNKNINPFYRRFYLLYLQIFELLFIFYMFGQGDNQTTIITNRCCENCILSCSIEVHPIMDKARARVPVTVYLNAQNHTKIFTKILSETQKHLRVWPTRATISEVSLNSLW